MSPPGSARGSLGIDLGGSSVKIGALDEAGEVLDSGSFPTELERGPADLIRRMADGVRDLGSAEHVGLVVPGLLDRGRGVVIASPNLSPIEGFPLRDALAEALALPPSRVYFENDANAAALAEHHCGAGRGQRDLLMVTLGTGVGGGLVLGDELVTGTGGLAGEVGHVIVDPAGPPCGCGSRGCLEQFASATAATRRATEAGLSGDLARLAASARASAGPERRLLFDIGLDLGRGLAAAAILLDLRCFVIGGGFGAALDLLHPGVITGLLERTFGRRAEDFLVRPATLGAESGWIGAAILGAQAHP